jgi:hypothetical protein
MVIFHCYVKLPEGSSFFFVRHRVAKIKVPMAEAFKGKSVALYFAGEW